MSLEAVKRGVSAEWSVSDLKHCETEQNVRIFPSKLFAFAKSFFAVLLPLHTITGVADDHDLIQNDHF